MPGLGFRRHLRPEVVPGDAVYVFSERDVTAVKSGDLEILAPLLDGTRGLTAVLAEAAQHGVPSARAASLIEQLVGAGLVANRSTANATAEAYWDAAGLDPEAATRQTTVPLRLRAAGAIDIAGASGIFQQCGLVVKEDPDAALTVVLCDDYLAAELAEIDAEHRDSGKPWLLAKPAGSRIWIGPVFGDRSWTGPCWHCLAHRLWGYRAAEAHVRQALDHLGPFPRPSTAMPAVTGAALHLVALEAAKWLAGHRYAGQRCVWTLDSFDLQGVRHEVRARPQCGECGDPALVRQQARRPISLRPQGDVGLRPEEVFDRFQHLISPVSGVVKEILQDRRMPAPLYVFGSGAMPAHGTRSVEALRARSGIGNAGKGVTAAEATTGALCEALERYSTMFHGDEETVTASFETLGDEAVHPHACQLYHHLQYGDRERWNRSHEAFQFVCAPFRSDKVIRWTPVWSLTRQRHLYLPTAMLYFGASDGGGGPRMVMADSNGNAAGASLTDAIFRGLLELIERDAVALWWYNRTRQPPVNLDAWHDPWIGELREAYAGMGREIWALDLTSDLGVPVTAALSRRIGQQREDIVFGFGAHPEPKTALRKALAELNQVLVPVLDPGDDASRAKFGVDASRWWEVATLANQHYLQPQGSPREYSAQPHLDPADAVESLHAKLRGAGLELLVLDMTRPDIGLPVAKVIVPGLRPMWARLAPGRLYDVPVKLGRIAQPTKFEDLNPLPLFV